MDALKITLPGAVTDQTLPKENEIVLKVKKQGDGTGLAYIGIASAVSAATAPVISILQGEGQLFTDSAGANPVDSINSYINKYFFLLVNSDECYLRITNAANISGLYTTGLISTPPFNSSSGFFVRINADSPQLDCELIDFLPAAKSITRLEMAGGEPTFAKTAYGWDAEDFKYFTNIAQLNLADPAFTDDVALIGALYTGKLILLTLNNSGLYGDISKGDFTSCNQLYMRDSQVVMTLESLPKVNVPNPRYYLNANCKGDLSRLYAYNNLYLYAGFLPDYSRTDLIKQTNLVALYIAPQMPLATFEALIADLNISANVTFSPSCIISIFVESGSIANVSASTKANISAIRAKGVTFTTNVII